MTESIELKKNEEIAEVLLNRPENSNAFDLNMVELFSKGLIHLAADDSVSAVVISGTGKAFCAGGDLKWVSSFRGGAAAGFHELAARYHQAVLEIRRMRKPVIAAINGIAAGGGFSLALACDFRIMAKAAILRQAYTANGLCIDGGGTFTLPRLVGLARAMELVAFDKPISFGAGACVGVSDKGCRGRTSNGRSTPYGPRIGQDFAPLLWLVQGASYRLLPYGFRDPD